VHPNFSANLTLVQRSGSAFRSRCISAISADVRLYFFSYGVRSAGGSEADGRGGRKAAEGFVLGAFGGREKLEVWRGVPGVAVRGVRVVRALRVDVPACAAKSALLLSSFGKNFNGV